MRNMEKREIRRKRAVNGRFFAPSLLTLAALFLHVFFASSLASKSGAADEGTTNVATDTVHFDSGGFNLDAFLAKPADGAKHAAVLMIHDASGLDDSMREIARQFAIAGFVALAPDFTSRLGGTRTPAQMTQAVSQLSPITSAQDARAAFAYLQKDSSVDPARISTVGFGWGGWRSFTLAVTVPEVYRAVIYCGATPSQSLDAMHAPVLAHYAQFDFRTTGNALLTEKTMAEAGKKFAYFVYPRVNRGFYVAGPQYSADAAKLAWTRTLEFLK